MFDKTFHGDMRVWRAVKRVSMGFKRCVKQFQGFFCTGFREGHLGASGACQDSFKELQKGVQGVQRGF